MHKEDAPTPTDEGNIAQRSAIATYSLGHP